MKVLNYLIVLKKKNPNNPFTLSISFGGLVERDKWIIKKNSNFYRFRQKT